MEQGDVRKAELLHGQPVPGDRNRRMAGRTTDPRARAGYPAGQVRGRAAARRLPSAPDLPRQGHSVHRAHRQSRPCRPRSIPVDRVADQGPRCRWRTGSSGRGSGVTTGNQPGRRSSNAQEIATMAEAKQGSIERTWLIRDGHDRVPGGGVMEGDVFIDDGVIAAIGRGVRAPAGVSVYDASGKHVFPGFIDPHVHLGNFNRFEDDCRTETISAAAGGITTIVNYLKILRHRPTQESYERIFDEVFDAINTTSSVDVALHCVLSTPQHTQEIPLYARRGIPSFKFYLGYKGSEKALKRGAVAVDDGIIFSGFSEAAAVGDPA